MKKLIALIVLISLNSRAQNAISSSAHISTNFNGINSSVGNVISFLFYDDTRDQLILKVDLTKTLDSKDTTDNWLMDIDSTNFYFVGNLQKQEFVPLPNNQMKRIPMPGNIYLDQITKGISTELVIFQYKDQTLTSTNTNANIYDTYKVDFTLSFSPKDYKVDKGAHKLSAPINITVASGRINQLKPEFKNIVADLKRD